MYKTILVPIDLSDAERGKPMIEIARKLGDKDGKIVLINVVEDIPGYVAVELPKELLVKTREDAHEALKAMAKAGGIKADVEVRSGSPRTAILSLAEEKDADLIIIASHRPGLQDYLLGSTAARVVRHAKCSVLVVR
ncbi:MAG: universal stress protein [Hyphomicrobiales bacterium]|nr:universal stress protein [Hyphomicrobiales bacterium]